MVPNTSLKNPRRTGARKPRARDSVSDMAFRVRYLRRSREIYNRYLESKPWINQLYSDFLKIKASRKIVDVGCGPGDFTRFLAKLSGGRAKIIGIDSNPKSIKAARSDSEKSSYSKISYRLGDAYKIPLENGYADLTCCRTLLMHLTDPDKAVREMMRVTRIGGTVAAVEGGRMAGIYDPSDEDYGTLATRAYNAWLDGIKKLEGKTFGIGERLPGIFQKAGLADISAEMRADAWLYTDPRRKLKDVKDELRFDYATFKERRRKDRKYLLAGGMKNSTITKYFNALEDRTKSLLSNDQKLRNDASVYGATFFIVRGTRKN